MQKPLKCRLPVGLLIAALCTVGGIFLLTALRGYKHLAAVLFAVAANLVILRLLKRKERLKTIKMIYITAVCLLVAVLVFSGAFAASKLWTRKTGTSEYCIVLGCAVFGDTPSLILSERIATAEEFLKANPDKKAILCGGKGTGENISEAECMYRELVARGIDSKRLISEDKSTTTEENLQNAVSLADIKQGETVTVITSDTHLYRAMLIAKRNGLCATGYYARTQKPLLLLSQLCRESVAVWYYWLFK